MLRTKGEYMVARLDESKVNRGQDGLIHGGRGRCS